MTVFNYKELSFSEIKGEHFHVLSANFLDHNGRFKEITITWNQLGRRSIWVAQFSGDTTEYAGDLPEVLEKVLKFYKDEVQED